uniref:DivN n=1 Tax=Prochloron didemni TaxID=1216 RepID=A0A2H4GZ97_PRODI|nr:DivN [Prochloron didemni]
MYKGLDRDEIRQIQVLMLLCLCLSPQSKLRQLLEIALAASETQIMTRMTPCDDVNVDGLFTWVQSLFAQGGLTEEEKRLLKWQNESRNMLPAIDELKTIEKKLGFKIRIQKLQSHN